MKIVNARKSHRPDADRPYDCCFVLEWDDSETTAAIVGSKAFFYGHISKSLEETFDWPVAILEDPRMSIFDYYAFCGPQYIAVRTDCYPLLWIWLWVQLRLEAKMRRDIDRTVWIANMFGWAETPLGQRPSWKDFLFVPRVARKTK
jgi:hypothetical protein